jgi:hypothetical protein
VTAVTGTPNHATALSWTTCPGPAAPKYLVLIEHLIITSGLMPRLLCPGSYFRGRCFSSAVPFASRRSHKTHRAKKDELRNFPTSSDASAKTQKVIHSQAKASQRCHTQALFSGNRLAAPAASTFLLFLFVFHDQTRSGPPDQARLSCSP